MRVTQIYQYNITGGYSMTLKALAEDLHVSVMTIYRRAKAAGVSMADLRGSDGGLTAEGVSVLASLFDGVTGGTEGFTGGVTSIHHADNMVEVARLTAEVDGLRRLVAALERERDDLRRRLDASEAERRQRDQLLLPGGIRGWWRRFRGGGGAT